MLSAIGQTSTQWPGSTSPNAGSPGASDRTAALDGEVLQDTVQLNDWVTCVSASTPKGKAEIQSLSAKIGAAKEQIARLQAEQKAATESDNSPRARLWQPAAQTPTRAGTLVNTWA